MAMFPRKSAQLAPKIKVESPYDRAPTERFVKPTQTNHVVPRLLPGGRRYVEDDFFRYAGRGPVPSRNPNGTPQSNQRYLRHDSVTGTAQDGFTPTAGQGLPLLMPQSTTLQLPTLNEVLAAGGDPHANDSTDSLQLPPIAPPMISSPQVSAPSSTPGLARVPFAKNWNVPRRHYYDKATQSPAPSAYPVNPAAGRPVHSAIPGHGFTTPKQAAARNMVAATAVTTTMIALTPAMKVFAKQELFERILLHLDMPALLRCLRIDRQTNTFIRCSNVHLRRALWLEAMVVNKNSVKTFKQDPHSVDPLISRLRTTFDFFYNFNEATRSQEIIWFPSKEDEGNIDKARLYAPNASWRQMLVMRSAEPGMNWRVGIWAKGKMWYAELGVRARSPVFNEVVNVLYALGEKIKSDTG